MDTKINFESFITKLTESVTIAKSPLVGFSNPPTFFYKVLETGEKFSGSTGNAKEDYMLWKASSRIKQRSPWAEEPMDTS